MPGQPYLRGSFLTDNAPRYVRWDGLVIGVQYGWANLVTAFDGLDTQTTTNGTSFGGFIGYNTQWDELVLGIDGGYNHLDFAETSSTVFNGLDKDRASFKLTDYATLRARAGYAFGQFMPYAFLGGAVGRLNYSVSHNDVVTDAKDNAYTAGFVAGVGIDVALLPNVFLRGEWEYVAFAPVSDIRASTNTARAGIGIRF
jgi:opacity protein-like surface antigen